ncbi:alpha/beta hydrolase [Planctomyces sp. SH-PL62]|uniref:alpha/beta hydrolase n=1 Tax=Planctomyces sp. SH-PL62 TaxID=1636152 RepID=UPI0018D27655|nr:alpha/beta hydrolase fold domain-containing protein [Planctomyces sp. SH-PL62]
MPRGTRNILTVGWLVVAIGTAAAWGAFPARPSGRSLPGVSVVREIDYGSSGGTSLKLDLLLPEADPSAPLRPILVAIHGGGWTGGARRQYGPQFASLARSGLAVAIVDYRLARPGAPSWKGALDDVEQAVEWLIRHASAYRLDPSRIATFGTSSGGLLAARAAQEDSRILAAVCVSSPSSLLELAAGRRQSHEPSQVFLGADPAQARRLAREASPLDHVEPGGPAMLLIHGEDDAWVPIDQARRLHEALLRSGAISRLVELPGARHGFELKVNSPPPRDLAPLVLDFLDEVWRGSDQKKS